VVAVGERDRPVVSCPGASRRPDRHTSCDHDWQSRRKLGEHDPGTDVVQYVCGKYTETKTVKE
jgi:hypothetical protein